MTDPQTTLLGGFPTEHPPEAGTRDRPNVGWYCRPSVVIPFAERSLFIDLEPWGNGGI